MNATAEKLTLLIDQYLPALQRIPATIFADKPNPSKWSKKEIIGHLVDSAHSNTRRFIVAQYEDRPLINYNQEKWVAISGYQQWDKDELVRLWYLLNKQACAVLNNLSPEAMQRECMTQELHTIGWLAEDYLKHLLHHLHQVLEMEPIPYP